MRIKLLMLEDGRIRVTPLIAAMGGPAATREVYVPPRGFYRGYRYRRLRRMWLRNGEGPHKLKDHAPVDDCRWAY